ncbi:MAG: SIMPL domain-containing protein [Dehalococcoidia bacterium]|nr:SIMPL domain-containing protein [Dehalococcoidia bacterium]
MRRTVIILAAIMLVTVSLVGCSPSPSIAYQGGVATAGTNVGSGGIIVSQQNIGLWVNGLGKTTAAPDVVVLTLGVESQQKTVAQAQKDAIDAMSSVMQMLKDNGIAEKDIQTSQYNIQQVTRWDDNQDTYVVIGYRVTNTVTCKIRDINKAGSIIDKAVVAGGDLIRINGINFTVDDPTPFYKIAREKAVQYAMEKARQISQASGTRLGKVLYISEDTSYTPPMVGNYAMKYTAMDSAAAAPTPISAGELEFQVTITMVYEIN